MEKVGNLSGVGKKLEKMERSMKRSSLLSSRRCVMSVDGSDWNRLVLGSRQDGTKVASALSFERWSLGLIRDPTINSRIGVLCAGHCITKCAVSLDGR